MHGRICQHEVLYEELDISNTADSLLQIKGVATALVQRFAHSRAHAHDVIAQLVAPYALRQCLVTDAIEFLCNFLAARDSARARSNA